MTIAHLQNRSPLPHTAQHVESLRRWLGCWQVGEIVKGTVASIEEYGLLVKLTASIKGVCPTLHLSDSGSAGARLKFKVGQKVRARWRLDSLAHPAILSMVTFRSRSRLRATQHIGYSAPWWVVSVHGKDDRLIRAAQGGGLPPPVPIRITG